MTTSKDAVAEKTWVAFGPAGAIGTVHKFGESYTFKLLSDETYRSDYPSLDVAKNALYAAMDPGSDWPEFREH